MLLPVNVHPEDTIYYNAATVLNILNKKTYEKQNLLTLYQNVRKEKNISFQIFILCLDWLYLLNIANLNKKGEIELCF